MVFSLSKHPTIQLLIVLVSLFPNIARELLSKAHRQWWRNLRESPEVLVLVVGIQWRAHAQVFTDQYTVRQKLMVMLRLQRSLRSFFQVRMLDDGSLTSSPSLDQAIPDSVIIEIRRLPL